MDLEEACNNCELNTLLSLRDSLEAQCGLKLVLKVTENTVFVVEAYQRL